MRKKYKLHKSRNTESESSDWKAGQGGERGTDTEIEQLSLTSSWFCLTRPFPITSITPPTSLRDPEIKRQ